MPTNAYAVLDPHVHRDFTLHTDPGFQHSCATQLVSVAFSEVVELASCMPVVVVAARQSPAVLSALLGLKAGENLFSGSQWHGHAVPLRVQAAPFHYALEAAQLLTLIDEQSPLLAPGGAALFASDGAATPVLKQRQALLMTLANGQHLAGQFVEQLQRLQLLQPLEVTVSHVTGETDTLTGLYTIDEHAFAALPAEILKRLQDNGMLAAMHAMLLSLRQFNRLVQLARSRGHQLENVQLG